MNSSVNQSMWWNNTVKQIHTYLHNKTIVTSKFTNVLSACALVIVLNQA